MEDLPPLFAGADESIIISTANHTSLREITALLRESTSAETFGLCSDRFWLSSDNDDVFSDSVGWNDFCQALQEATSIQKLSMDIPDTMSDGYLQLARATIRCLQVAGSIRILELKPCTILGDSFRQILDKYDDTTAAVAAATTNALLQRIDTLQITCSFAYHSFQSYHDHEINALCDWLTQMFDVDNINNSNHNHNLTTFRLDGYRVHSHRRLLTTLHSSSLSLRHSLQHISLSGLQAYLDGRREPAAECESLAQVLRMPQLHTLALAGLVLAPCHAAALAQTLPLSPSLTSLALQTCRFPDAGGQVIATALEQFDCPLQSLTIQSTRMGTSRRVDSVVPLQDISPQLEILHLTNAELDDTACERISQGLMATASTGHHRLRELYLDSCQLSVNGICSLMQSLQYNTTLQTLSIQNVDMSDPTISVKLAMALQMNQTLESLTLDACSLSDDSLGLLVDAIVVASNVALQTVNLSHHTGVTNTTIASTIPKLLQCKYLYHVDLSGVIGDPLSDDEGQMALNSLLANYEMQDFCIDVENKDIQLQIETMTRLNKAGRRYLTADLFSREDGVRVLSRVKHNLNDVFTHLQENPGLCSGLASC